METKLANIQNLILFLKNIYLVPSTPLPIQSNFKLLLIILRNQKIFFRLYPEYPKSYFHQAPIVNLHHVLTVLQNSIKMIKYNQI